MNFFKKIGKTLKKATGVLADPLFALTGADPLLYRGLGGAKKTAAGAVTANAFADKPKFVPAGFDVKDFYATTADQANDPGLKTRREALNKYAGSLQDSIASGDIMSYNAALAKFRKDAGMDAEQMPDTVTRKPRKVGSREKTLRFF